MAIFNPVVIVKDSVELIKRNLALVVLVAAITALGSVFTLGLLIPALICGSCIVILRLIRSEEAKSPQPSYMELKEGLDYYLNALILCGIFILGYFVIGKILSLLVSILGIFLYLLIVFVVNATISAFFLLSFPLLVTHKLGFKDALLQSLNKTKEDPPSFLIIGAIIASPILVHLILSLVMGVFGSFLASIINCLIGLLTMVMVPMLHRRVFGYGSLN